VSRKARAVAFGCAAVACAGLAAAVTGGYRSDVESQLGPLRPVVVAREAIPARRPLRRADAATMFEVRRIPQRFAPPGALSAPEQAVGRALAAPLPPGAYLLADMLRAPRGAARERPPSRLDAGRKPVEISVSGADALSAAGPPEGGRVDVIVTTEPGPGGHGRTYVAAEGVELLALGQSAGAAGAGDFPGPASAAWSATLALTRPQALRLIQAQNFAREVRLIPR
jgi:pilus assembly protein CpaB